MRSIERLIRDELAAFLSLNHRSYFEDDHSDLVRLLTTEQWIAGNTWKVASEVFSDYGLVSELGCFVDEFVLWSRQVDEIRGQWFYDHIEAALPADYLRVFGHTSALVQSLDPMLNRCRRIVRRIDDLHEATPATGDEYSQPMRKSDVRKLLGISERTLGRWIAEGKLRYLDNEKQTIRIHIDHLRK
ncbi:MAG TPA: hypothetical protein DDZ51_02510 [Planctomycetaceae bacterium]|nr:hypothetical protein [Planctomycetaceae bacterium]